MPKIKKNKYSRPMKSTHSKIAMFFLFISFLSCKKSDIKPVNPERHITITMTGVGLMWYEGNLAYGNPGHTGLPMERTVITDGVPPNHYVSIAVQSDNVDSTMSIVMVVDGVGTYKASGKGKQQLFYQN